MAIVGLRVRDRVTGLVIVEITDRLTRFVGRINSGSTAGAISVPAFAMGAGFATLLESPRPNTNLAIVYRRPRIAISGTTLSWDFPGNTANAILPCDIIYGVY